MSNSGPYRLPLKEFKMSSSCLAKFSIQDMSNLTSLERATSTIKSVIFSIVTKLERTLGIRLSDPTTMARAFFRAAHKPAKYTRRERLIITQIAQNIVNYEAFRGAILE